jgi:hypothetical protein
MRLVCHLYDSNASAMSNVFRRSSTMSLIRQSMYAANMPNSTYVDQWDMEKFMEQVDRAKRKVPELRIRADKYMLPDIFKRTKKASGDVKEWLQHKLDDVQEQQQSPNVLVTGKLNKKGVGFTFKQQDHTKHKASAVEAVEVISDDDEAVVESFEARKFECENITTGSEAERSWLTERADAAKTLLRLSDDCDAPTVQRQLVSFLGQAGGQDQGELVSVLRTEAMCAADAKTLLTRLKLIEAVEEELSGHSEVLATVLKAKLQEAVATKDVSLTVACLTDSCAHVVLKVSNTEWVQQNLKVVANRSILDPGARLLIEWRQGFVLCRCNSKEGIA